MRQAISLLIQRWALNAPAILKSTPEDLGLTRETGFTVDYTLSQSAGGSPPPIEVFNQVWGELCTIAWEINRHGCGLPYDDGINYVLPCLVTGSDNVYYEAVQANGPGSTIQDPVTDTSNTYWNRLVPSQAVVDDATTIVRGIIRLAQHSEVQDGTDDEDAVTSAGLATLTATEARRGLIEIANNTEIDNGTDTERAATPSGVARRINTRAPLASPTLTGNPTAPTQSAGNNSIRLATTAFVNQAIATLVDSSPGTLDTLNELAAAIDDDPNFDTTIRNLITNSIAAVSKGITGETDSKSANYTVDSDDEGKVISMNASGTARTVTLPDLSSGDNGFTLTVVKTDSSSNNVTIDGHSSDTINGETTYDLEQEHEAVILKWNGTAWLTIGGATGEMLRDFFGGASQREFTTAGANSYTWEWGSTSALVIITGGGGGGGGRGDINVIETGGDGGDSETNGLHLNTNAGGGGDGGENSTVLVNGTTYTSVGGGGGGGSSAGGGGNGGNGGNGEIEGGTYGDLTRNQNKGGRGGGGSGDNFGTGRITVGAGNQGGDGGSGEVRIINITGLSASSVFSIVVGDGGDGGQGSDSSLNGSPGTAGRVTIIPLF